MTKFTDWILGAHDFPARWLCGNWSAPHGWIHIVSDILVWAAYLTIPIILIYFISRRKDMPFPKILWLFALFIFACGTGHLLEAITYWVPIYRVSAINKILTATVSWATVLALIPIVPFALSLKSPSELQLEIDKRIQAEEALMEKTRLLEKSNEELQQRHKIMEEQTKELHKMNQFMIGRENKMAELKKTVKQLQEKLGPDTK